MQLDTKPENSKIFTYVSFIAYYFKINFIIVQRKFLELLLTQKHIENDWTMTSHLTLLCETVRCRLAVQFLVKSKFFCFSD